MDINKRAPDKTKVLPLVKRVYTVTPDNPRALDALALAEFFSAHGIREVTSCESVEDGIRELMEKVGKDGIVCAFGSFYMAGAIRKMFGLN